MSDWGVKIVEGLARLEERMDKRLTTLEEKVSILESESWHEVKYNKRLEALEEKVNSWYINAGMANTDHHKIGALEERCNSCEQITMERETDIYNRLENVETLQEKILITLCDDEYGEIIPKLKELLKQLEAKP